LNFNAKLKRTPAKHKMRRGHDHVNVTTVRGGGTNELTFNDFKRENE
jgi:hypothetical protein